jgi:hypothetical protein
MTSSIRPRGRVRSAIDAAPGELVFVVGTGASLVHPGDILVYADLARWEAQLRMRRDRISNLGCDNRELKWSLQYKRAFFTDWRVCDRLKRELIDRWDFVLDTHIEGDPRLADGAAVRAGLCEAVRRPFRVVPFFDPGPWGGQWMREVCDLDPEPPNFAWCFDCVPEENSIRLRFGDVVMELPSLDVLFHRPRRAVRRTACMQGSATSFRSASTVRHHGRRQPVVPGASADRIHPAHFGMHYTQDESYYMLDAGDDALVYLGTREGIDPAEMAADLEAAQRGEKSFDDERFVNRFPAAKHDHFLIPAGTCHCSGANSMVLEISATPYIFTFKMWDWDRLGLDGKPRPVHLGTPSPTSNGSGMAHGANASWSTGSSRSPRAMAGARSAPGCTSASSSRRGAIGSPAPCRTTPTAASTCSTWWKGARRLSKARTAPSSPSSSTMPRPSSCPPRSAPTRSARGASPSARNAPP